MYYFLFKHISNGNDYRFVTYKIKKYYIDIDKNVSN